MAPSKQSNTSAITAKTSYSLCYPETEVSRVSFYLMGSDDHTRVSHCNVVSKDLFSNDRPLDQGIYSLSMGTTSYSFRCKTCKNTRDRCPGHFGIVQLRYPVINALFRGEVLRWLRRICHQCGAALGRATDSGTFRVSTASSAKPVVCATCEFEQPFVSKDPREPLFLLKRDPTSGEETRMYNDEIEDIFHRVSDETVSKINCRYHLSALILRSVPAIPNNARPDVSKLKSSTRSNNNDTTTFIKNVVSTNEAISLLLTDEEKVNKESVLNLLEITYSNMVRDPSGTATSSRIVGGNGQALTSLGARLRGKEGRIRGNLEGKRFQHGGRSVICGDNNIDIDEVGIPISMAKILQVPVVVRPYNYEEMMTYFNNRNTAYPGCSKLVKGDTGATYHIASIREGITLEFGDILYRDLVDGDEVAMNRAPSLLYSAISGHRARILDDGDTLRLYVNVADTFYGGDFDGDAMSVYLPHSLIARTECAILSNLKRWFISLKDRSPALGVYHDNAIGMAELTRSHVRVSRYQVMQLLSQVKYASFLHRASAAAFYKPEYAGFIDYRDDEINVVIERGELRSGVLDKKSIGQGVNDSLFHNVFNEYGVDTAMNLLFNMQQRYRAGLITPPIGMTTEEFYEQEQMNILSPGDEFTEVVMSSIDHENNNLAKLVSTGTKGKPTNILQISSSIGQMSIKGQRMRKVFDFQRALPYARRFHDEPEAVGFNADSFITGVNFMSAIAQQQDGRNGITTKALSTGTTGYHNRKANKALESVLIDNHRRTVKYDFVLQQLYGDDGVDIRKAAYVDFKILMVSDAEFDAFFKLEGKQFNANNATEQKTLDDAYENARQIRDVYRTGYSRIESCNFKDTLLSSQQVLPVNPLKVLENVVYRHREYLQERNAPLRPTEWQQAMIAMKRRLRYTHYNEICERAGREIPAHVEQSFALMDIGLDVGLAYKRILDYQVDAKTMGLIADRIVSAYKKALVEYGTSIGMFASECTSESMTQRILDSIHASGASKSNFLNRIKEVYGAKSTDSLENAYMDVFVKPEFEDDMVAMQRITNEIEMMNLRTFVNHAQIFFETYECARHPDYKAEAETMHDNAEEVVMRIYFGEDVFRRVPVVDQFVVYDFLHTKLLKVVIRGVDGIMSASVLTEFVPRTVVQPDGSMRVIRKHIIRTQGTNLTAIINHNAVDVYKTASNSILEIQELYGIHAARMKMIQCLRELSGTGINIKHYTLIADTLTANGFMSNIERGGVAESNPDNALLSISYSHPIQTITEAALNNEESVVHSNVSSALMMGTSPNVGSNYNGVMMNERFISEHTKTASDILDDL
ncbi:RNA polymerase Rpb1, domain 4 [Phytophthora cactorum]|nr:RNA polymerase Rpb1, domain 4 [Phytophthora cactorum]